MVRHNVTSDLVVWLNQLYVTDLESLGQLIECYHSRIPQAAFKTAEVLLTEARTCLHFLLRQALFPA